jgi:hypothetical protein
MPLPDAPASLPGGGLTARVLHLAQEPSRQVNGGKTLFFVKGHFSRLALGQYAAVTPASSE